MIIVKLMGGLGNQMFQYAAGKCLSHLHNTELLFDLNFMNRAGNNDHTQRSMDLNCFDLRINIAGDEQIKPFQKKMKNKVIRTLQRKLPILFDAVYFSESGSGFHKEFFSLPGKVYLEGYWQSETYFLGIEEIIRKEFSFDRPLDSANASLLEKIGSGNSVSLHVRRGDYVNAPHTAGIYAGYDAAYYRKALDLITKKTGGFDLYVFSDDIDWCKANLNLNREVNYVTGNTGHKNYIDMQLMSACKHNIIANSSFSWWAAWLNNNPDKMVLVPPRWYKVSYLNEADLIPHNKQWIRVN